MAVQRYTLEELIKAAEEQFGLVSLMARQLNCAPNTVRAYIKRYPTLAAVVNEQRESMVDRAELSLRNAIMNGEQWAVTLALKTIGKSRGYVERQENFSLDVSKLTDDQLDRLAKGEDVASILATPRGG